MNDVLIVSKGARQSRKKKKSVTFVTLFLRGGGGSEVIVTLFILCLKWPIIRPEMQRKFWVEGGQTP